MLEYSARLNEKLIKHAVHDVTEEEKDFVVTVYKRDNSFYYPRSRDIIAKNNSNISIEEIDKIFTHMTESALSAKNPLAVTVRTLLSCFDTEEEEDILDEIEIHTKSYEYLVQEYRDNKHQ